MIDMESCSHIDDTELEDRGTLETEEEKPRVSLGPMKEEKAWKVLSAVGLRVEEQG